MDTTDSESKGGEHFISEAIRKDLESGRFSYVRTRFPPEPNGFLHIGHVRAITIDFTMADRFGGECNLRFDDTNPVKEDTRFVEGIQEDIRWLGFSWARLLFTSDYFEQLYQFAHALIDKGLAYVDEQSLEEVRESRGTLTEPGKPSPYRERPIEESRQLFTEMREGKYPDGAKVLRAKIDMASPNLNLRDPVLYRILHKRHHRTGEAWCIYPMYDFAHGQSDSIEEVTHSLCSLEFEDHRPLYDWFIQNLGIFPSRQIEFAKLNFTYTVLSKRRLREMVEEGLVEGWDDPRMPTLVGMRRRGVPAQALRELMNTIGVTKYTGTTEIALLEHTIRGVLNRQASRFMAVMNPLEVIIENYPEGQEELLEAINNPEDAEAGTRQVPFARQLYIERDDFLEDPPRKFFRLGPGREVRLRYAYFITCRRFEKDAAGNVTRLYCTYDPETRGGDAPDGRKVKGTLHWVSATHAKEVSVRLYDRLFTVEHPMNDPSGADWKTFLNPESRKEVTAHVEPALVEATPGTPVQFERVGYFTADTVDSRPNAPVFNRTITLKDSWARESQKP